MGTCPKCKLRIRKNGNHLKLGSVWFHKIVPEQARPHRQARLVEPHPPRPRGRHLRSLHPAAQRR